MKQKPLTFTLHIGGKQVETLTEEQAAKIAEKFSEVASRYYSLHPEEYAKLKGK